MTRRAVPRRPYPGAVLLAAGLWVLAATGWFGCTVEVVSPVAQTREEIEALGTRPELQPEDPLLSIERDMPPPVLANLLSEADAGLKRLSQAKAYDIGRRRWQAVTLHNQAVALWKLQKRTEAQGAFDQALEIAEAFDLAELRWQILYTRALVSDNYAELLARTCEILEKDPAAYTTAFNPYSFAKVQRLYSLRVKALMEEGKAGPALMAAERGMAVLLPRAFVPQPLRFEDANFAKLAEQLAKERAAYEKMREAVAAMPTPKEDPVRKPEFDTARRSLMDQKAKLSEIGHHLQEESAGFAALYVPVPGDADALVETLRPDLAVAVFWPVRDGTCVWAITETGLEGRLVQGDVAGAAAAAGGVWDTAEGKAAVDRAQSAFGDTLAALLPPETKRLYIVAPGPLSDLPWARLRAGGKALGERMQIAWAGGLSDILAAFDRKSFRHQDVLLCYNDEDAPGFVEDVEKSDHVTRLNLKGVGRDDALGRFKLYDVIVMTGGFSPDRASPMDGFFRFPGDLARVQGLDLDLLAARSFRGYALCVAGWNPRQAVDRYAQRRAIMRAAILAGFPSVVLADGAVTPPAQTKFWQEFIRLVQKDSVGAAFQAAALAARGAGSAGDWCAFTLNGHIGLNPQEFQEYSRAAFRNALRQADFLSKAKKWDLAAMYYREVLVLADALKLDDLSMAGAHSLISACWRNMGRFDRAAQHQTLRIHYLAQASDADYLGYFKYKVDPKNIPEDVRKEVQHKRGVLMACEYLNLGVFETEAERFEQALAAFQQAAQLFKANGEDRQFAETLTQQGLSLDQAGQYEDALKVFEHVRQAYGDLKDYSSMARQLERIAIIHMKRLNQYYRAEQIFEEARAQYEKEGDQKGVLRASLGAAIARRSLGDLEGSLKALRAVEEGARKAGDDALAAQALTEVGNTLWFRGNYQEAFETVRKSNALAEKLGDAFQLNVNAQLEGLIYWELNQYDRSHEALDRAMKFAEQARAREEIASAWNNKGLVYRREKRYPQAVDCFGQALKIDQAMGSRWGMAYDYRNLGIAFRLMGQLDKSEENIRRAVALCRAISDEINLAKAQYALGDTLYDLKRYDQAAAAYDEARVLAEKRLIRDVEWRAVHGLGKVEAARGNKAKAAELLKQAVAVVEAMRGEIKVEEFRNSFLSNKLDLYEDLVTLLADLGRPEEALNYSERSRARNFIDIFSNQSFSFRDPADRQLYDRQQALLVKLRETRELLAAETNLEKAAALNDQLNALKKEYSDLLLDIKLNHPSLSSFVEVDVISLKDLQGLLKPDAALVVYYTTEREYFVWLVRSGSLRLFRFPVPRADLEVRIRDYRERIQNRDNLDDVLAMSRRLYGMGTGEVLKDLPDQVRYVGVVPHGPFHYLSFASLKGYRGDQYLVERFSLFYAPSASILKRCLSGTPPQKKLELNILAVGNPDVGNAAFDLPFAQKEVTSIERDYIHVTALTGKEATKANVLEHIGNYQVIHFASHGEFDSIAPLFSALKLAPTPKSDGDLEVHEITGVKLNAVLVTLSACQSGLGKLDTGDELISLSSAFVYAGTRSILSTLWRVDDVATALVVKHFYRNYVREGAADSLRDAQNRVLNDGRHAHPSYWAGMTLTGDYR